MGVALLRDSGLIHLHQAVLSVHAALHQVVVMAVHEIVLAVIVVAEATEAIAIAAVAGVPSEVLLTHLSS